MRSVSMRSVHHLGFALVALLVSGAILTACSDASQSADPDGVVQADGHTDIRVETDGGTSPDGSPIVPEPTFAAIDVVPPRGLTDGGETVTLVGVGFIDGMKVYFGDVEAPPPFVPNTTVAGVVTPPNEAGIVDVRLVHPDGREWIVENGFAYHRPFGVTSISPPSGPLAGGVEVEITGFGFADATAILIGGRILIDFKMVGDTVARGFLPPGDLPGLTDVGVVTEAGRSTLRDAFTYTEGLSIGSVAPYAGSAAGGQKVEVRGTGFTVETSIRFGTKLASVSSVSKDGRRAQVTVPPGSFGAVDVKVTEQGEAVVLEDGYFYLDPGALDGPTDILQISPVAGPTAGGKLVSIVAAGLHSIADTRVRFGSKDANIAGIDLEIGLVTAVLPAGAAGAVDVTLETANGTDTSANGFTYFSAPAIQSLSPDRGPVQGGNSITIKGSGFTGVTAVRIGALYAPSFQVVSDTQIDAVAPPGSPGWATVVVESPSGNGDKEKAYVYETGSILVVAVDPDRAALPGGAAVHIIGTDFPVSARVFFDDVQLSDVVVEGPTSIRVVVPSWEVPAAVDVSVMRISSDVGDTLENAFTYFNPAATSGGTWGPQVDGMLNVSVLDMWSQQGIPNAFVILWADESTEYKGNTDSFGNITFQGPDLAGQQMVTAWAPGYSASTIVEFDAENVTVLLFPSSPPSTGGGGGGGGSNEPAVIRGRALINDKYLIPPPGNCAGTQADPVAGELELPLDFICQPCSEDLDCGPLDFGNQCTSIIGSDTFCTTQCESGSDCPSGYACLGLEAGAANRCIPVGGTVRVTCRMMTSAPFNSPPGGVVQADIITGEFEFTLAAGQYGIVCQGEVWDPATDEVTILSMGAAGPVTVAGGDVVEGVEVPIDVPFTRSVTLALDYPPSRLLELPHHRLRALLAFGDYGFHEVVRAEVDPSVGGVLFERMPDGLTGSLSQARWYVMGGAYSEDSSFVQWFPPYSTAILRELPGLGESHLWGMNPDGLLEVELLGTEAMADVYGVAGNYVVAVGDEGAMYRYNGSGWVFMGSPLDADWRSVWGSATNDFWAVGAGGRLARWNGAIWNLIDTLPFEPRAVGGTAGNDVWVVGDGGHAAHFDGADWTEVSTGSTEPLHAVWGDAATGDVWIVGDAGTVLQRPPGGGITLVPDTFGGGQNLRAVGGNGKDTLVAAGEFGHLRRRVEGEWLEVDIGDARTVRDVWVAPTGAIFAVGERGLNVQISASGVVTNNSIPNSGATLGGAWGNGTQPKFVAAKDAVLIGPLFELAQFEGELAQGQLPANSFSFEGGGGETPDFNWVVFGSPWWRPVWQVLTEGSVEKVNLPDFGQLVGQDQLAGQGLYLEITRGRIPGFDMNNFEYVNLYFKEQLWSGWSVNATFIDAD